MVAADTSTSTSASASSTNYTLVGSYATIVLLWYGSQVVYIPYVAHLLVLVTAILYAACHGSLVLREEEVINQDGSVHSTTSSRVSEKEVLRKEDAYHFPLIGSLSLFSLYLAFKFLDKDLVNLLIGAYFAIVGCLAVTVTISPFVQRILPGPFRRNLGWEYKLSHPLPEMIAGPSPLDLSAEFNMVDILTLIGSGVLCWFYFSTKLWYLNNILGVAFCLQGIERFSLGTYKIGAILLIGLFFYDIFWVFGTDVMVTVAKNLDGPIKILFPRGSLDPDPETGKLNLSLLGLGDIVIPGFFLALLLRFDAHLAQQPVHNINIHASFPKPYFTSALLAYIMGLGTTLFVMIQFDAAQPALLYLVPACLGSSFLCATVRGEIKELFAYSEEEPEEEDGVEKETTEQEKKTN